MVFLNMFQILALITIINPSCCTSLSIGNPKHSISPNTIDINKGQLMLRTITHI